MHHYCGPVHLPPEEGAINSSYCVSRKLDKDNALSVVRHRTLTRAQEEKKKEFSSPLIICATAAKSLQSCPTLSDPMDCSPPGSSFHEISQARTLEWVAMPSSRGSSQPRDQTPVFCVSCIHRQILYYCTTWEDYIQAPKSP